MKTLVLVIVSLFSFNAYAIDIASCSNPSGKAYYPELGLVTKKDSGWTDDKISSGLIKLSKDSSDSYDILFVDATKQIISSVQDGGTVLMVSRGHNSASFLVIYPGKTVEIYTFIKNTSGELEYIVITNRSGDQVPIVKSSLMRGDCSYINFDNM